MKRKRDSPDDAATTSACVGDGDSPSGAEFEVFLSFRGPDTRLNFTDYLYRSLVKVGIRVFRDNEEIREGDRIGGELLRAIESSKICMPIFSRDYASSAWCLRELRHMVECWHKANDKVILPIFYEVDPDDVKLKTRLYLDALEKHEEKLGHDVQQWKKALTEVATIKGWATKDKGQGEIIDTIVAEVFTRLKKKMRNLPEHLVGIHHHVQAIMDLLNKSSQSYLVIHGMSGIGKTTLATAVYNQIFTEFEGSSFLSDIREFACHGRLADLQEQLISDIRRQSGPFLNSVNEGIVLIKHLFPWKKVLIILDDVDKWDQLSKLAGKTDWFGPGSKIIITTRDVNFLPIKEGDGESSFQALPEEFQIYEMTELNYSHALHLFSRHAFGTDSPPHDYDDISRKIISKTGGLPLALMIIGSSLSCKSKKVWKATFKKLSLLPPQEVFDELKISYDMLQPRQREIFLDIACYFIREERLSPYYMWKAFNYFPRIEELVLARMSLIKIKSDRFWMHDQLRDFGREIIQREDINVPARRSRLWEPEIALKVVQMKEGTDKIVALTLTGLSKMYNFTSDEFSKLPNLRFLELQGGNLVGDFKNLLSKLAWLSWIFFPSELNAANLRLVNLVVLKLFRGFMTEDWIGWEPCLVSKNLKVIEIDACPSLKRIPNFLKCSNLKKLALLRSGPLLGVDGFLSKQESLKHLEICSSEFLPIEDCEIFAVPYVLDGLKSLSTLKIEGMHVRELHSIGEMTCLEYLSLKHCCSLRILPESIRKSKSLLELELEGTEVTSLPHSIGDLKMLRKMSLVRTWIEKLPVQIGGLESLCWLDLKGTCITELPASIGNLKKLETLLLVDSDIRELPKAIGMLENLQVLDAEGCRNLEGDIPNEIGGLSFLRMLDLSSSKIRKLPKTMNQLSHLQELNLRFCYELEHLPELPMSLINLEFSSHLLWTAIDLSYLTNLVELRMSCFTPQISEFIRGAPKIEWIEGLSNLKELVLAMKEFTFPPVNLAPLYRLQRLEITLVNSPCLVGLPSGLSVLVLYDVKSPMESSLFSNLTNLSSLTLCGCRLREVDFDDVLERHAEKLHRLSVTNDQLLERLSVSKLRGLQSLDVSDCPGLMEIQGGEILESLETLVIRRCSSLERLPDLSELKKLGRLQFYDCPLTNSPGLRLQDTCLLTFEGCGISPAFAGDYKEWKDTYGHSGDDINGQL